MFLVSLLLALPMFMSADVIPAPSRIESETTGKTFCAFGAQVVAPSLRHAETHRLLSQLVQPSGRVAHRPRGVLVLAEQPLSDSTFRSLEAYELRITPDTLFLSAGTPIGFMRGAQTLLQMRDKNGRISCGHIVDAPAYEWRGLMLDVSRHFFSVDFLKKQIDLMAAHKLNRLHLHLTDAAGWRMEIKRYPRLTSLAAWRDATLWKDWWKGSRRYVDEGSPIARGGYYTQAELRELVAYAAGRGVEIVPEIEMPAHSEEVLTAYPELSCTHEPYKQADFCAGNDKVYEFLQNVLDEVMDVFPSRYIHIGGDEAGKAGWKTCRSCRKTMLRTGILSADTIPDENQLNRLQAHFIGRIGSYLSARGRRMLGWDEVVDPTLPSGAVVMLWRDARYARQAAGWGYEVILSPASHCYLDAYQDAPPTQPEAIGGYLPFDTVASFAPETLVAEEHRHLIKGVQGNLWTEYIATPSHAEYMIYPRLLALAEIGWCGSQRRPAADLRRAVVSRVARLRSEGVNAFELNKEVGQRTWKQPLSHKGIGADVVYHQPCSEYYAAAGDATLVDGKRGGWSYHDRLWQGFIATAGTMPGGAAIPTLDVTLDLGKKQHISWVGADFMQVCNPEIFYPSSFKVSVSTDGEHYTELGADIFPSRKTDIPDIRTFSVKRKARARYIRVQATPSSFGGWLFTDEIIVK